MACKVCFWMRNPSPHQSAFFDALAQDERVDIQVRYFGQLSDDRVKLGWNVTAELENYEQFIDDSDVNKALIDIPDWPDRIHIIMGKGFDFNNKLLLILLQKNLKWIHWGERYGISLASLLKFNMNFFHFIHTVSLWKKRIGYGRIVNKYALGAFAQGELAKKDFISMGISENKIENLFYTIKPILNSKNLSHILPEKKFKHNFIYVGALTHRKGIDLMLKAFAKINTQDWGLILIGEDRSNGLYSKMIDHLNITENVLIIGSVPIVQVHEFIKIADVLILPSRFDGWGAVLNEAALLGKAMIASNEVGASFHLIKHAKNGFRVKEGSVQALKDAMQVYANNPQYIDDHGRISSEVYNDFTPEANVERFLNAIVKWESGQ